MTKRSMAVMLVLCGTLAPSAAFAQYSWGRGSEPKTGVCFYKDPDFRGDYFCARDGESDQSMPSGMNDKISSIRIFGNAAVIVFQDSRFEGRSSRFDFDVPDLHREGWNDLISSFRISGGWGHKHGHGNGNGYGNGNGGGYRGDPDVVIRRAYQDVLDREPDAQGMRVYRSHIIGDGWNEAQVREALRSSPEYRQQNTMTYPKAREIVRQAYLNVLRREPDSGATSYVNNVLHKRWTQQDVERELRKSPEYRNRR
jgi:Peptidase inhibitor family I36